MAAMPAMVSIASVRQAAKRKHRGEQSKNAQAEIKRVDFDFDSGFRILTGAC